MVVLSPLCLTDLLDQIFDEKQYHFKINLSKSFSALLHLLFLPCGTAFLLNITNLYDLLHGLVLMITLAEAFSFWIY